MNQITQAISFARDNFFYLYIVGDYRNKNHTKLFTPYYMLKFVLEGMYSQFKLFDNEP